jgi:hypothetical protein
MPHMDELEEDRDLGGDFLRVQSFVRNICTHNNDEKQRKSNDIKCFAAVTCHAFSIRHDKVRYADIAQRTTVPTLAQRIAKAGF